MAARLCSAVCAFTILYSCRAKYFFVSSIHFPQLPKMSQKRVQGGGEKGNTSTCNFKMTLFLPSIKYARVCFSLLFHASQWACLLFFSEFSWFCAAQSLNLCLKVLYCWCKQDIPTKAGLCINHGWARARQCGAYTSFYILYLGPSSQLHGMHVIPILQTEMQAIK